MEFSNNDQVVFQVINFRATAEKPSVITHRGFISVKNNEIAVHSHSGSCFSLNEVHNLIITKSF